MIKLNWNESWVQSVQEIGREAGKILLRLAPVRGEKVSYKSDNSPVTLADTQSDILIQRALKRLTPDIPIISEETSIPDYSIRSQYKCYWLIDPLDGTKEFVKGLNESCVCIALIMDSRVVFSLIDAPFWSTQFLAITGLGAREYPYGTQEYQELLVANAEESSKIVILQSRSKPVVEGKILCGKPVSWMPLGSALKFCSLARGDANLYFRWTPFCEWDAAAGHLIAEEAGARVTGLKGEEVRYNRENLLLEGIVLSALDVELSEILALQE